MRTSVSDTLEEPTVAAASWTRRLWLVAPLGLLGVYAPIFPPLVAEWREFPNLSHGFAIPFIAAYLVWCRRDRIRALPPEPSRWGLPVFGVGLAGLVVGVLGQESFVARVSFPVAVLGLVLFLAGARVAGHAWLGIAYLWFMIPLPWTTIKTLTYRSRLFDAWASAHAVSVLGVPVLRDGFLLQLPDITLEVADVCSSIPAMAALLSLGVAYASLAGRPRATRLVLVAATIPFAIVSNVVRITTTAAAVYYVGPWTLHTVYHQFNGTVIFVFTLVLLLALDALLARGARGVRA